MTTIAECKKIGGKRLQKREARKRRRKQLFKKMAEHKLIYLMLLPVAVSYLVFSYLPMYGIILSVKEYRSRHPASRRQTGDQIQPLLPAFQEPGKRFRYSVFYEGD